ncbi:MAG: hypothetical protein H7263_05720 [Candidatus Sericytochromatia bacterium]|nr:hypothetical protein [Candidatus Sericytochromatia bacterium]
MMDNKEKLNKPIIKDFVKENSTNVSVIHQYIANELLKHDILHNVRTKDQNISILRNKRNAVAFIDFKVECSEYGYPVVRIREEIPFYDARIVPYSPDGNCKFSKRYNKLEGEKVNIGITNDDALELTIKALKSIL